MCISRGGPFTDRESAVLLLEHLISIACNVNYPERTYRSIVRILRAVDGDAVGCCMSERIVKVVLWYPVSLGFKAL